MLWNMHMWKREYKYLYTIKNMYNGNILYPVGSSCITKFDRKDLREKTSLMESQFKLLHAVEEGKFLSLSVELFSRKLLLWCTKKEQFIAGGGEDEDETIIISAKWEAYEEANIGMDCKYSVLDTQNSIPTYCFKETRKI